MLLKNQDLLVLLKLAVWGDHPWRQEDLAHEVGLTQSQIHMSLRRAAECGLYDPESKHANGRGLFEILVHSIRFLMPGSLGGKARGMPTAWGHRGAFRSLIAGLSDPPVWAIKGSGRSSHDDVEGLAVLPLHEKAPGAAMRDPKLYEVLAAVDALRVGRARDMELARELLRQRLAPA